MPCPMWCCAWEMPGIARCDVNGDVMCKAGNDTDGAASVEMLWIPCVRAADGSESDRQSEAAAYLGIRCSEVLSDRCENLVFLSVVQACI